MSTNTKIYWATTGLFGAAMLASGFADLARAPAVAEGLAALGYPAYLMAILGVWKLLGVAAIAAPRFPRLKEWAYAGFVFELTGASLSHAMSGDPLGKIATPLVLLAVGVASWALRPASRKLESPADAPVLRHATA